MDTLTRYPTPPTSSSTVPSRFRSRIDPRSDPIMRIAPRVPAGAGRAVTSQDGTVPARQHPPHRPVGATRTDRVGPAPSSAPAPCPAPPHPATASFTWLGVYWTTSQPASDASARANPLAWPTLIAVRTLTWKNTCSTATTSGANSATSAVNSVRSAPRRCGNGSVRGVVMTPREMATALPRPRPSTTANPHRVSPGSMPSTRHVVDAGLAGGVTSGAANTGSYISPSTASTGDLLQFTDQFLHRAEREARQSPDGRSAPRPRRR